MEYTRVAACEAITKTSLELCALIARMTAKTIARMTAKTKDDMLAFITRTLDVPAIVVDLEKKKEDDESVK